MVTEMTAFGTEQIGRVLGGRYRIIAPVGTGASATVFQADDVQLRRRVAVKVLHPSLADDVGFIKRFRAEAQAAAALSHPNILAVFDWGEHGGTPYLVTEYLSGGSLRAMLDVGRRLTPSQALMVGLDAARGLDYAHRRGFVHRDIKPANLLFDDDGRLRIADFGLARALAEAAWTEPAGVVLGTARYASPEQARGLAVDGRTDIYSLALVLVEVVTGHVPFAADTTVATLMARLDKLMPVTAEMGPLASVVERAGRPDPAERFDAAELGRALALAAERLPRPEPLPLVSTMSTVRADSFGAVSRRPDDPATAAFAAVRPDVPVFAVDLRADPEVPPAGGEAHLPTAGGPPVAAGPPPPVDSSGDPPPVPASRRSRRGWLLALLAVILVVAGGAAVWIMKARIPPKYPVPDLVRQNVADANRLVKPYEFQVETKTTRIDGTKPGEVTAQDPPTGSKLEKGAKLTLVVSDGPTLVGVPDLTGKSDGEAKALLQKQGLAVDPNVVFVNDEEAPAHQVMDWTHKGEQAPKGTVVQLTVSTGPAPRTVPAIKGSYDDASSALKAVGLVPRRSDRFSDTVPAGTIISADVKSGTQVPRGSVVNISVSKGPDLVTVPNVAGQTGDQATAALKAAGLNPLNIGGLAGKPVTSTDPAIGQKIKRGSDINIILG